MHARQPSRLLLAVGAPLLILGLTACGSDSADSASSAVPSTAVPSNVTPGDEEFCGALADFDNETNLSDVDDTDNPSDAQIQQLADQVAQFTSDNAATMPADIKPAFESLAKDLKTISSESGSDMEQLRDAIDTITSLKQISTWTKANCGFDF